jgi:phospholipid/cholesterol/gamma-HCH transport system ATP-binding protein
MVSVRGVSHAFGPKQVLRDLSLEVGKGEIMAIMGSSGGGKTTLLKCISGLLKPDAGEIEVAGIDSINDPEAARHKMGMVFQSAALFDYLNVEDNILFGVRRWSKKGHADQQAQVKELLSTLGLEGTEKLMPNELSGGMRKRVGIARALAMQPEVMLYDEPTTGLDPVTVFTIDQMVVNVREKYAVTSVLVSHDVTSVFRTADRIAFLDQGELIFVGGIEEFQASREKAILELVHKSEAKAFEQILRETH